MALAADGGGGGDIGPKERELLKIYQFSSEVGPAAKDWGAAADQIEALAKSVEATRHELSASWKGEAATAAYGAMDTLKASLTQRASQLRQVSSALEDAVTAANAAQSDYENHVATVPTSVDATAYTTGGMCKSNGTTVPPKLDQAAYDQAVADQRAKREARAGEALSSLDTKMSAATQQVPVDGTAHRTTGGSTVGGGGGGTYPTGGTASTSPFNGASTSSTNHYVPSSGWNTQSGDQTIAQVVPSFGSSGPGGDFVTSVDGTVSGVIPGSDVSLPPGVSAVSGASGSGLTGAAGVGGVLAGGISVGGILRGGSGAARGGLSGLTSGLRGGLGSVVADGEAALGSAGGRGAVGMVRGGAAASAPGGAGAAAGEAAGGRGGLMAGGGGQGGMGGGAGGSAVRGASSAGKYGVPKLDGPGGRGGGAAAEGGAAERAAGSRGSAGSRAAAGTGGTAQAGGVGGGAEGRHKRDRDYLTHEDEENWYDDETGASPSVWE